MVVLPQPGGPQRMSEASRPEPTMRPTGPSGASRWSCPTTSSSACGRRRSASGRGAWLSKSPVMAAPTAPGPSRADFDAADLAVSLDDDLPASADVFERIGQLSAAPDYRMSTLLNSIPLCPSCLP